MEDKEVIYKKVTLKIGCIYDKKHVNYEEFFRFILDAIEEYRNKAIKKNDINLRKRISGCRNILSKALLEYISEQNIKAHNGN